jgi:Flp pilus assembly protein TadD
VVSLAFTSDGRQLASAGDQTVRIWNVPTLEQDLAACRRKARELGDAGAWDAAFAESDRALKMQPENALVWDDLGRAHQRLGQWEQAHTAYTRAVELLPQHLAWRLHRASVNLRLERWQEAADDQAVIVQAQPNDADTPLLHRASLLLLAGDRAGYRKLCTDAQARFGSAPPGISLFGVTRVCTLAPEGVPADPTILVRQAQRNAATGRLAWFLSTLGMAQYRSGQFAEALTQFDESDRADPHWGPCVNALGRALAHHRLGHAEEARSWRDRGVRLGDDLLRRRPADAVCPPINPNEWLEYLVRRREVDTLLNAAPNKDKNDSR